MNKFEETALEEIDIECERAARATGLRPLETAAMFRETLWILLALCVVGLLIYGISHL